jgi:hypothetical protein
MLPILQALHGKARRSGQRIWPVVQRQGVDDPPAPVTVTSG